MMRRPFCQYDVATQAFGLCRVIVPLTLLIPIVMVFCPLSAFGQKKDKTVTPQKTSEAPRPIQFGRDIRPLLARHCLACHGMDEQARQADLRLDLRSEAIEAKAIIPGNTKLSELVQRIETDDDDLRMPPPEAEDSLTRQEKEILKRWISEGAVYEKHWSFELPKKAELPVVSNKDWPQSPIDFFILDKIEQADLAPSGEADRLTWLRRVSLDLTGLPPSGELAEKFLVDPSPEAHEMVVHHLLQSKAFGEHWARMWLDLARYADTKGYEKDRHRDIWRYRDWVIEAFNADMPFDQFTREQLAGDLLPDRTMEQLLATAFHRNTMTNEEGGTDNEEFRVAAVKDRVDTTLQVWMGLTMGCAKCHSHKYDPISMQDYYSFYAFFNQTQDNDTEGPFWPTPTKDQARKIHELEKLVGITSSSLQKETDAFQKNFHKWKQQLVADPLWKPLKLTDYQAADQVTLQQMDNRKIIAGGTRPEKDTWTLTFDVQSPEKITSLRLEYFPQAIAGGSWPDRNIALQELTVDLVGEDGKKQRIQLKNPRSSFSQSGWQVRKAIDGNLKVGWALAPQFTKPQAAVFDFDKPASGSKLIVKLVQEHGQGFLLARSLFAVSHRPVAWNYAQAPAPDNEEVLKSVFSRQVFAETRRAHQQLEKLNQQLAALKKSLPQTPVMLELTNGQLRPNRIHQRGNFLEPGETVEAAVPSQFGEWPANTPENRLGVAQWLVSESNPLTARVMVNRVWARIFGTGIVETEEDFGTQGLSPSHPELLDWLAIDFREKGWSLKTLIKMIVLSKTYRQSSVQTPRSVARDPRNRLLSRGPRFRLSAEAVRDQALAASGLLSPTIGGPSVMPPQPTGIWKSTYNGQSWKNAVGPDRYRRAIYTYLKRTSPYPALQTFDAGSGEVCQIRRIRTNTPLQALVVLNDQAYLEAAGALAKRMRQSGTTTTEQITLGFRRLLIRKPTAAEINRLVKLYESTSFNAQQQQELLTVAGWTGGDPRLVVVANVLLNLDETLTKP